MTPRQIEEYRALRDTIRQRGTARTWTFIVGLAAWGALVTAIWLGDAPPAVDLVPLAVLSGTFEAVFALHTGVERIGRYIQVFFEGAEDPGWEHRIMAFGARRAARGGDPLFSAVMLAATLVNFLAAATASSTSIEIAVLGIAHVLLLGRMVVARRAAAAQRARDLDAFRALGA
jgi:hypothetical protein